ncbi:MAG: hypothetical protein AAFY41_15995, partial [Bacteroidota bacterium]
MSIDRLGGFVLKSSTIDDAYIFDRSKITKIFKFKTEKFGQQYDYQNYEVGSGKSLLSDVGSDVTNAGQTDPYLERPVPMNMLTVDYPFDINNLTAVSGDDLGLIDLTYVTGSTLPQYYIAERNKIENNEIVETKILEDKLFPARVQHATIVGNQDNDIELTLNQSYTGLERTYSLLLRLPPKELNSNITLVEFGDDLKLVANKESELVFEFNKSVLDDEHHRFISTINEKKWLELDIDISDQLETGEVTILPYLNGQQLDTIRTTSSGFSLLSDKVILKSTASERAFEIGYIAAKPRYSTEEEVAIKSQLLPSIKNNWELFFGTGNDEELANTYLMNDLLSEVNIKLDTINVAGISSLSAANSSIEFINYGNLISVFSLADSF